MAPPVRSLIHSCLTLIMQIDRLDTPHLKTEKYLFQDFLPVVKTSFPAAFGGYRETAVSPGKVESRNCK